MTSLFKKIFFGISLAFVFSFALTSVSVAQTPPNLRNQINNQINAGNRVAGLGSATPQSLVARIIKIFLTTVGITFTVLIVLSGYNLLTAAGDESKVEKAKNTIKAAVIGLAVTLAAYSITTFIGKSALEVTSKPSAQVNEKKGFDYFFGD